MKKYLAEMVGTMVLVLMGCGAAVSLVCTSDCTTAANAATVVGTSLAFGLAVVGMAYTIGGISGCHINPAITLAVWLSKRMSGKDAVMYMLFQVIGAIIGAAILFALVQGADISEAAKGLGSNAAQTGVETWTALVAEIVFTFVFVLVVLGATSKTNGATNNLAGLAIGLTLVLVHLACIRYTGTSVNPARSIGPALFACGDALQQLWIFIVGPFVGAALSAACWRVINGSQE